MIARSAWLFCALPLFLFSGAEAGSPTLRVMTYKIRYDNPADGADNWKFRRESIGALVRFHDPDLLGIQEGLDHQVRELAGLLPGYDWRGAGRDDGEREGEYAAIFYRADRFRVLADSLFWLSPTPDRPSKGWDAALNRIVTWACLRDSLTGSELFFFNTHFDHQGVTARAESARLLAREVARIAGSAPVVVTGDFNAGDQDQPYAILTGAAPGSSGGLEDTGRISRLPHHGPRRTYCGFDVRQGIIGDGIDFIFARKGMPVLRHATLTDFMESERFPSDHLPVIAEIVVARR